MHGFQLWCIDKLYVFPQKRKDKLYVLSPLNNVQITLSFHLF